MCVERVFIGEIYSVIKFAADVQNEWYIHTAQSNAAGSEQPAHCPHRKIVGARSEQSINN